VYCPDVDLPEGTPVDLGSGWAPLFDATAARVFGSLFGEPALGELSPFENPITEKGLSKSSASANRAIGDRTPREP
jgi:hypothetical protein